MAFIIDYLTSILVGSVVLVILLVSQIGSSQSQIDQQTYASARRQSQAFALMLEEDFLNIGYGTGPMQAMMTEWTDSSFAFNRKLDTLDASPVVEVRYAQRLRSTIAAEGGEPAVPVHQIVRLEDGVVAGGSTPNLTAYTLVMVDRAGDVTTDLAEAIGVRVAFGTVFGTRQRDVRQNRSYHSRTYYPPLLDN